ncbi:unnamed protein product [Lactuca virosa]|uniref:UHRF1-binding protein 1-like n=1 Tax=Lactuca virosa TaxID=75947 RepID=A0AAU9PGZ8_9ASTR|nr:unnamed protein product [Lactuca virosa]
MPLSSLRSALLPIDAKIILTKWIPSEIILTLATLSEIDDEIAPFPLPYEIDAEKFGTNVVGLSSLHTLPSTHLCSPLNVKQLHPSPPTSPAVPPSHASDTTIAQQNSDSSSGSSDAKEQNQKAHTHSQELEKQVDKLWLELNLKLMLREDLETRSKELDQKMIDINPKLQEILD